jgi:hypothetical protein
MNSLEFRAVLDWWMVSDPWPESVPKGIVDTWLQGECHLRGYHSIIHAYHRHESEVSAAPASPALPPEQASGPALEAGSVARGSATLGHEQPLAAGNEPAAQPLSDSALARLGQAMLADYVAQEYVPSRGEIAMHAMQGILAHAHNDVSYEGAARDAVVYAEELLAALTNGEQP